MLTAEVMGFVGGALTTGAFIPQVVRVYRNRSAGDISLPFTIAMILGAVLWLTYGILNRLYPVIFWNSLSVVLVLGLLAGKRNEEGD